MAIAASLAFYGFQWFTIFSLNPFTTSDTLDGNIAALRVPHDIQPTRVNTLY